MLTKYRLECPCGYNSPTVDYPKGLLPYLSKHLITHPKAPMVSRAYHWFDGKMVPNAARVYA